MTAAPGVNATRHEATTVDPGTEGPRAQTLPAPRPDLRQGAAPQRGGGSPLDPQAPRGRGGRQALTACVQDAFWTTGVVADG